MVTGKDRETNLECLGGNLFSKSTVEDLPIAFIVFDNALACRIESDLVVSNILRNTPECFFARTASEEHQGIDLVVLLICRAWDTHVGSLPLPNGPRLLY